MATNNPFAKWADPDAPAVPPAAPPAATGNPFEQWAQQTPIDRALAERDAEIAAFRAEQQRRYEQQQAYARQLIQEHPELAGASSMQEPAPALDPYNAQRTPPLAPRESAPKQPLGSGFSAATQIGFVEDQDTKRKILADTLFPGDPSGIWRVGFDRDGKPVYVGDDGKLHQIASGTASFGANLVANSPEMLGTGVGAIAGPWGATLGAMGTHGLKRSIAGLVYDEPQTYTGNLLSVGKEGAITLAGEGIARGLTAVGNRGRVIDFTPADARRAEQIVNDIKAKTGIDLDLAQASGDRRLIALRAYVARYPGPSANLIQASEEAQKGQFHEATERVLDAISKEVPAEVAGQESINAAKATIALARHEAQQRVDPLYRAAYESEAGKVVTDPAILKFFRLPYFKEAWRRGQTIARLEEKEAPRITVRTPVPNMRMTATETPTMSVREVPGAPVPEPKPPGVGLEQPLLTHERPLLTHEAQPPGTDLVPAPEVNEAGELIASPGAATRFQRERTPQGFYRTTQEYTERKVRVPDLRGLDYTKRGLDSVIEDLQASGQRQLARALSMQRRKYVAALDDLGIPEYQAARAAWTEELRTVIDPLENGVVGVLARIKDPAASKAAARIFSDPNLTESMIFQAKNAIQPNDAAAWDQLTRTWIAHQYNKAQRVTQTGSEINAAGKFHQALFGTPTARKNTIAMLNKESADVLEGVMDAASKLASTPTAGSNTFRDQETAKIFAGLTGKAVQAVNMFRRPFETIRTAAERRAVEQATLDVAKGILDPTQRKKLRVILRMKPSTQRNILLFNTLGAQTAKDYAQSRLPQGENSHLVAEDEDALSQQ